MAKKSMIQRNVNRAKLVKNSSSRRAKLKSIVMDRTKSAEERWSAQLKLAEMPRNGAKIRLRNRCAITGRPRGYHRRFNMSRIALRELGSCGLIPGLVKASW